MSWGMRVRGRKGDIYLSPADQTTRFIYNSAQTNASGGSGTIAELNGKKSANIAYPVNQSAGTYETAKLVPLQVSRTGNAINWVALSYGSTYTPQTCVMYALTFT